MGRARRPLPAGGLTAVRECSIHTAPTLPSPLPAQARCMRFLDQSFTCLHSWGAYATLQEERKPHHLGEILVGDRMMKTLYALPFLISFDRRTLCSYTLKSKEMDMFQKAIDEDYYFEMFYDDIPVQGFIGDKTTEVVNGRNVTMYSLFTHYIFTIGHNGEEVLEIQWDHNPESNLDITDTTEPTDVHFVYTAKWVKSQHASREHVLGMSVLCLCLCVCVCAHTLNHTHIHMHIHTHICTSTNTSTHTVHKESPHQHLEIRWFSIFNSIVTVLLLTGFLATILLRILKNDFTRYARVEEVCFSCSRVRVCVTPLPCEHNTDARHKHTHTHTHTHYSCY